MKKVIVIINPIIENARAALLWILFIVCLYLKMTIKKIENNNRNEKIIKTISIIKHRTVIWSLFIQKNARIDIMKDKKETIKIKNSTHFEV